MFYNSAHKITKFILNGVYYKKMKSFISPNFNRKQSKSKCFFIFKSIDAYFSRFGILLKTISNSVKGRHLYHKLYSLCIKYNFDNNLLYDNKLITII